MIREVQLACLLSVTSSYGFIVRCKRVGQAGSSMRKKEGRKERWDEGVIDDEWLRTNSGSSSLLRGEGDGEKKSEGAVVIKHSNGNNHTLFSGVVEVISRLTGRFLEG